MNSRLAFSVLACVALAQAQSDQPVINTPQSVVQCLPSLITFSGGSPPYTISAIPGGQAGAAPLADLGSQSGSSYTWKVNLAAGTAITLQIRDSRGVINYSQAVTIQPSSDSSCLGSGSGSGDQPSTTSPNPPVSTGATTASGAGTNSSSAASPTNSTSNSNSTSTSNSTNSTSTGRLNSTTPITTPSTVTPAVSTPTANNQTRGPSVFTPSSNSSVSTNAQNSAAPGTSVHTKSLFAGFAIAAALSILA